MARFSTPVHTTTGDAALSGNRSTALHDLLRDAQIVSLDIAQEILEASLAANAEWLPLFHV